MPVQKVGEGYRWGDHGKVYYGNNAKENAEAQGRAAHANGYEEKAEGVIKLDKLKKMIQGQIEDESKGVKEYQSLIDEVTKTEMDSDIKELVIALLKKIQTDESTHYRLLEIMQKVINN